MRFATLIIAVVFGAIASLSLLPKDVQGRDPPDYGTRPATVLTLGIHDDYFDKAPYDIEPGTTVHFVNYGRNTHTVSSMDGRWDSGDILPGSSYSALVVYPGTYHFFCRYHRGMEGAMTVADTAPPPPRVTAFYEPPPPPRQKATSEHGDLGVRGIYLVKSALLCIDCHTPQTVAGAPDETHLLQGAVLPIRPKKDGTIWADQSPDITASGLAGQWSEDQMVRFLMTGIDPNGKKARSPMPPFRLNDEDARAIAVYLKSVPGAKRVE